MKCKYDMVISRKTNALQPLNIDYALGKVEHTEFLGVWISANLSWRKHTEEVCKNARKKRGFIYGKSVYFMNTTATLK